MNFKLNENDDLEFTTDQGLKICVSFKSNGLADCIGYEGYDFYRSENYFLNNFFVQVDGKFYSISQVWEEAESQYDDLVADADEDARTEQEHVDYVRNYR